MSMTDPIADMLTHIRNGHSAKKVQVTMPSSTVKTAIAKLLKEEGFIKDFSVAANDMEGPKPVVITSVDVEVKLRTL